MNESNDLLLMLLRHPAESRRDDYKAAKLFQENTDFALKLVKHCLGLANSGGGYLIMGYKEGTDKHPAPDPALDDEIVASYDVTRMAQFINSFIAQGKINLIIPKVELEEKRYPIICVRPFDKNPLFCKKSVRSQDGKEEILREGAIYVRTHEAKTVIAGASEWQRLINVCVDVRKTEFLEAEKALLGQYFTPEAIHGGPPSSDWLEDARKRARSLSRENLT